MRTRGYSLVGMLITIACIVVLFSILMTSMNKAVTGEGSAVDGTVFSTQDKMRLNALYLSLTTYATANNNMYPVPSEISGSGRFEEDTTANLYSAMIAQGYFKPEMLISANEFSAWVEPDMDYDFNAYDPHNGTFWDSRFEADLKDVSNTSFAHMPLYGGRFDSYWASTMRGNMPILGSRGPKNGVHDTNSLTYGRNAQWAGHALFSDGSIDYLDTFTPSRMQRNGGEAFADNIFAFDDGVDGHDGILGFTFRMTEDGPELLWD